MNSSSPKTSQNPEPVALPVFRYQGNIQLITKKEEVKACVEELEKSKLLGFDTETRPAFKKGESYLPCLLQLANENSCYLFRLNKTGLTADLIRLLSKEDIVKAGVAIRDDLIGLKKLKSFEPGGFIEIADMAKEQGHQKLGLRSLAEELMEIKVSKKMRTSNWERKELSPQQMAYAAADAHLGLKLFQILKKKQKD